MFPATSALKASNPILSRLQARLRHFSVLRKSLTSPQLGPGFNRLLTGVISPTQLLTIIQAFHPTTKQGIVLALALQAAAIGYTVIYNENSSNPNVQSVTAYLTNLPAAYNWPGSAHVLPKDHPGSPQGCSIEQLGNDSQRIDWRRFVGWTHDLLELHRGPFFHRNAMVAGRDCGVASGLERDQG